MVNVTIGNPHLNTLNNSRLAVISKDGVPEFGPTMPVDAVFKKGEDFRNFFYVKCKKNKKKRLLIFL